jgi:hypothetical protein
MQTVLSTSTYARQAKALRLSEDELRAIETTLAADPLSGDVIPGTGGARKMRVAGRGHGKRGGYRTIHYYGGDDVPVFLLAIYGKDARADLTESEKNELAKVLPTIADAYRAAVREKAKEKRHGTKR